MKTILHPLVLSTHSMRACTHNSHRTHTCMQCMHVCTHTHARTLTTLDYDLVEDPQCRTTTGSTPERTKEATTQLSCLVAPSTLHHTLTGCSLQWTTKQILYSYYSITLLQCSKHPKAGIVFHTMNPVFLTTRSPPHISLEYFMFD